jgi:hypothetical protein
MHGEASHAFIDEVRNREVKQDAMMEGDRPF